MMGAGIVAVRVHDSPVYRVKSLPNGWHEWCIDIRYLLDGWMVMPRAWERLERFTRWEYKRKDSPLKPPFSPSPKIKYK
jgi:hypothetical protein